ncbi:MAG: DNA polymerase I [Fibrobacteria bacterium]|nr:DNA polymerase I [Fibrobacteria bacterium]
MSGLYLVDAMALAYRSFYALMRTGMRAPDGTPTAAIYGFAQALLRVVESRDPSHMAIVRDLPVPTFRHEMYPAYKAQRSPMPDDLRAQIPLVERLAEACGLPVLAREGFEADDLMATYAKMASGQGLETYLMTRDKDLMALVDDKVRLFDPGRGGERPEVIDAAWVEGKMGVPPRQVRDLLALMGDASDNIPGVPRVGEKTATELLRQYPDIDAIYTHLEEIGARKKALRGHLEAGRESMELSRRLVTLRDDVDPPKPLEELTFSGLDYQGIRAFLSDLGIRALLPQVEKLAGFPRQEAFAPSFAPGPGAAFVPPAGDLFAEVRSESEIDAPAGALPLFAGASTGTSWAVNHQPLETVEEVRFLAEMARGADRISLMVLRAGDGARPKEDGFRLDRVLGVALSWNEGLARHIPLGEARKALPVEEVAAALEPLLSDASRAWIAWDAKETRRSLQPLGLCPAGRIDDGELAAYLLAPGERHLSLERQAESRLSLRSTGLESIAGSGRSARPLADLDLDAVSLWWCERADLALRLWTGLEAGMREAELWGLYENLELPLQEVLRGMEDAGIALDDALFKDLSESMGRDLSALEAKAHEAAGRPFNVASPRQLEEILFDDLGLKSRGKTATGKRSTDSDTLEALRGEHALPAIVLEHREYAKLKGTYVDPLPLLRDASGRVHTRYDQTVAATGRLSSVDPNLQNIPVRGETGRRIRRGFVAAEGHLLISADYSQIELRLLAHLTGDPALLEVYRNGQDIHARTAAQVAGVAPHEVTADQRRAAKVVNFGVMYGMGPHALSQQIGVPHAEAKAFIDGFFAAYSRVQPWMEETLEQARSRGWVRTILGRKRWIREINDRNRAVRERAEREAVNTPVQGSAADLVKKAMLDLDRVVREESLPCRQLLQVHDELVLEVESDAAQTVAHRVRAVLEGAMELDVPLVAETGVGRSWGEAH